MKVNVNTLTHKDKDTNLCVCVCVCKGCSCSAKCSEQSDWVGTRCILYTQSFPPQSIAFYNIFLHLNRLLHEFKVSLWMFTLSANP